MHFHQAALLQGQGVCSRPEALEEVTCGGLADRDRVVDRRLGIPAQVADRVKGKVRRPVTMVDL